ncbi:MAG: hypothetical protein F6K19_13215 [Cyanothece sp. SIO1E1]|nr:hypothetical protein [Cyanothece sp. SIO1E1]
MQATFDREYVAKQYRRYLANVANTDPLYRIASNAEILSFDRLNEISIEGDKLSDAEVDQIVTWVQAQGIGG